VQVFSPTGLSSLQLHVPVIYSNFSGFCTYYSVTDQTRPWEFHLALKITVMGALLSTIEKTGKKSGIWSLATAVLRNHYTHPLTKTVQTHLYSWYGETPIIHHNANLTEKLKIKESVKSGKTKKTRRLIFLIAFVSFIIKIKFTQ
jgi:hypothetical protein